MDRTSTGRSQEVTCAADHGAWVGRHKREYLVRHWRGKELPNLPLWQRRKMAAAAASGSRRHRSDQFLEQRAFYRIAVGNSGVLRAFRTRQRTQRPFTTP